MERETFRHLDREWEAAIADAPGGSRVVRFRSSEPRDEKTYEASIDGGELGGEEASDRELALRRGLESALVLDALAGHESGLTAQEVADMTGLPAEAAEDRLEVLDSVQPVLDVHGPRRYRTVESATED